MHLLFTHWALAVYSHVLTLYSLGTCGLPTVYLQSTCCLYVQRMHLLINSLVTMLRLEEEEQSDALAAAYEPFVGFAPADPEA